MTTWALGALTKANWMDAGVGVPNCLNKKGRFFFLYARKFVLHKGCLLACLPSCLSLYLAWLLVIWCKIRRKAREGECPAKWRRWWECPLAGKLIKEEPKGEEELFDEAEIEQVYHQIGCNWTPGTTNHQGFLHILTSLWKRGQYSCNLDWDDGKSSTSS